MLILDSIRDAFPAFDYHIGISQIFFVIIFSSDYYVQIQGFISLIFLLVLIYGLKFVLWETVSLYQKWGKVQYWTFSAVFDNFYKV